MVQLVAGVKILISPNTSECSTAEAGCVLIVHLIFEEWGKDKTSMGVFLPRSLHKLFPTPPWG